MRFRAHRPCNLHGPPRRVRRLACSEKLVGARIATKYMRGEACLRIDGRQQEIDQDAGADAAPEHRALPARRPCAVKLSTAPIRGSTASGVAHEAASPHAPG